VANLFDRTVTLFSERAEHVKSINFQIYFHIIAIYAKTQKQDWSGAIDIIDNALVVIRSKKYVAKMLERLFLNQKAGALIALDRHVEAQDIIRQNIETSIKGSSQWFKSNELSVANALYAQWYAEAWDTIKAVMRHERFESISPLDQESWRMYYGYLCFLVHSDRLALSPREKGELGKFRMQAWLNDLPYFSKDKRGANIPILLLQVHFLLLERRFDDLELRVEALKKYKQRNLDPDDEHFRTDVMIRLLELLVKHHYNPAVLAEKSADLNAKMATVSADLLNRSFEIEIVPYQCQWQWMLEACR
jgi:hypothetical protein